MGVIRERQLDNFVSNHVFCCLTGMVEDLIGAGKIEPYKHIEEETEYYNGDYWTTITVSKRDEIIEELEEKLIEKNTITFNDKEIEELKEIQKKIDELNELGDWNYPEVFEYWGVDNWLAEKLKEQGEVIIEDYLVPIWGRQTTGQSISLDKVIGEIFNNC